MIEKGLNISLHQGLIEEVKGFICIIHIPEKIKGLTLVHIPEKIKSLTLVHIPEKIYVATCVITIAIIAIFILARVIADIKDTTMFYEPSEPQHIKEQRQIVEEAREEMVYLILLGKSEEDVLGGITEETQQRKNEGGSHYFREGRILDEMVKQHRENQNNQNN